MPFANIKVSQAALSTAQKEEIVHRVTAMFVDYFSEAGRGLIDLPTVVWSVMLSRRAMYWPTQRVRRPDGSRSPERGAGS